MAKPKWPTPSAGLFNSQQLLNSKSAPSPNLGSFCVNIEAPRSRSAPILMSSITQWSLQWRSAVEEGKSLRSVSCFYGITAEHITVVCYPVVVAVLLIKFSRNTHHGFLLRREVPTSPQHPLSCKQPYDPFLAFRSAGAARDTAACCRAIRRTLIGTRDPNCTVST
jgi:hypothetical protein